jgi:hypothetical protein
MTEQSGPVHKLYGYDAGGGRVHQRPRVFASDVPEENPDALAKLFTGQERDAGEVLAYPGARHPIPPPKPKTLFAPPRR